MATPPGVGQASWPVFPICRTHWTTLATGQEACPTWGPCVGRHLSIQSWTRATVRTIWLWRMSEMSFSNISRRTFLRGAGLSGAAVQIGLPPLVAMFNSSGTAYAAAAKRRTGKAIESRFVLWFNGNGIVENYWMPNETGSDYEITPCL